MWLFTHYGFFSVSCPTWDKEKLQVRARARKHLVALQTRFPHLAPFLIQESSDADYRYRIVIPKDVWVETISMLASSDAMFAVVYRVELVQIQQLGQLVGIDAIALVSGFQQGILARITNYHSCDLRLEQVV